MQPGSPSARAVEIAEPKDLLRILAKPDVFKPETRQEEVDRWPDFKFQLQNLLVAMDPAYADELEEVEARGAGEIDVGRMEANTLARSRRLYTLLGSYVKGRALRIVRQVNAQNGYEAYRQLLREYQPSTRARSLALVTQLAQARFTDRVSYSEQIARYEEVIREYERVSGETYSEDLKIGTLLNACPTMLKMQLQLSVSRTSTYDNVREAILAWERTSTAWSSKPGGLEMPTIEGDLRGSDPMDVGRVEQQQSSKGNWSKSKDKHNKGKWSKGFGKYKGGKQQKGKQQGKSGKGYGDRTKGQDTKGDFGKPGQGKGKSTFTCHYCGKPGHYAKDCRSRLRTQQVSDVGNAQQQPVDSATTNKCTPPASSAASSSSTWTGNQGVRRVRIRTPPGLEPLEIFDMTENEEFCDDIPIYYMQMISVSDASDLQIPDFLDEKRDVCRNYKHVHFGGDCQYFELASASETSNSEQPVIRAVQKPIQLWLDSGADVSTLPLSFGPHGHGQSTPGACLVDAQGNSIRTHGTMTFHFDLMTDQQQVVRVVETCVLSDVKHPLLAVGKMLKSGWELRGGHSGQLALCRGNNSIPVTFNQNSMTVPANICVVDRPMEACGALPDEIASYCLQAGWHLLSDGKPLLVALGATQIPDTSGAFSNVWWPCRITCIREDGKTWKQVENEADYMALDEPFPVVSDKPKDIIVLLSSSPFIGSYVFPGGLEANTEYSGYDVMDFFPDPDEQYDDEAAMQLGSDGAEVEPVSADLVGQHVAHADIEPKVATGDVIYTLENTSKELKAACREVGISVHGSKAKLLERLRAYYTDLEARLAADTASKLFKEQERPAAQPPKPRIPNRAERELHDLTHVPYQSWCEVCTMSRGKEDKFAGISDEQAERPRPVVQLDFGYGRTAPAGNDGEATGAVQAEEDDPSELGKMLVATDSHTKSLIAVAVSGKGAQSLRQCTEAIVRHSMQLGFGGLVVQADGEPSTKQLLKSVQEARRRLGLSTEIRLSGTDQHQSNGAAERAIQTIRRLANTYRKSLEQKIGAQVPSTCHIFPWATQHAAFIYNRFHVHRGSRRTSYEILTDTTYKGKICEFGESVLAKAPAAAVYKGSSHWTKGIWVGKSLTSDCHVILTKAGVMMARSVRRLPQPFDKDLIFAVRGLPWNHKPDGEALRLKRLGGRMHRQPQGVEDVVPEAEMQRMAVQVGAAAAASLMKSEGEPVTDEAGVSSKPAAVAAAAPAFSGKRKSSQAMLPDSATLQELVRGTSESSSSLADMADVTQKRAASDEANAGESPKHRRAGNVAQLWDMEQSIRAIHEDHDFDAFPDWDESAISDLMLDDRNLDEEIPEEHTTFEWSLDPPSLPEEEVDLLDLQSERIEVSRLVKTNVLRPIDSEAAAHFPQLSTRFVKVWKLKEKWYRRARLVARQYKWATDMALWETFSPASTSAGVRLLIVASQLMQYLPGQRAAASGWFAWATSILYGADLENMKAQPAIFRHKDPNVRLLVIVHVDDMVFTGDRSSIDHVLKALSQRVEITVEGPFGEPGDEFTFLKKVYRVGHEGVLAGPNPKHLTQLAQITGTEKKKPRRGTGETSLLNLDVSPALTPEETSRYRSAVGILMYISNERPDVQHVIHVLCSRMSNPTLKMWYALEHVVRYLQYTKDYCLLLGARRCGCSILENRVEQDKDDWTGKHLIEAVSDSDFAGDQTTRRSISSGQVYVNRALILSFVRGQKAITLSSGEAEYMALTATTSEAIHIKNMWEYMTRADANLVARTDSSVARAISSRQGVGRIRHLSVASLWLQERVQCRDISVRAIGTVFNPSDVGTKVLSVQRLRLLCYIMGIRDSGDNPVGFAEYEMAVYDRIAKRAQQVIACKSSKALTATLFAILARGSEGADMIEKEADVQSDSFFIGICMIVGFALFGFYTFCVKLFQYLQQMCEKRRLRLMDQMPEETVDFSRSKEMEMYVNMVLVTPNGRHYHMSHCKWLDGRSTTRVHESDAVAAHYKKCHTCFSLSVVTKRSKRHGAAASSASAE